MKRSTRRRDPLGARLSRAALRKHEAKRESKSYRKAVRASVRAAQELLAFTKDEITKGMMREFFYATRPGALHDELKHFLDVFG